ncbi:MAG TPA: hypothetical protein VFM70_08540 [Salinimicrobium sp.]|nr:hypothetical protein [Salinimicrobium sp.]
MFLKILIVCLAVFFIWEKLYDTGQDNAILWGNLILEDSFTLFFLPVLLVLSFGNWFFEIKKWKILASVIEPTTFKEAASQSLASLTASIFTPNRIGEYGAKSLFFSKKHWKKVLLLNFIGNMTQLLTTIFFGILGLIFLWNKIALPFSNSEIFLTCGIFCTLIATFLFFKNQEIGRNLSTFHNLKIREKLNLIRFSTIRYLLFSHQFYLILMIFGAEIGYFEGISAIFVIYLFASALPSIFFLEAVVKGSIALWIFSIFQVEEMIVLTTVGLMWLFNFAIPALVGSYYVVQFKPQKTTVV